MFGTVKKFLTDYKYFTFFAITVMVLDAMGTYFVINKVPYTEIDWIAYMQEVRGYLGGELNYSNMRGDTGPLVYPAGFVYLFSGLNILTSDGSDVRLAQLIWYGLYLVQLAAVLFIAQRSRIVPPWALFLFAASYRIHSIFVLRLFNDCWAMTLLYLSVALFTCDLWSLGCAMFSLAVSVKMNVLLYAPGLFCLLVQRFGFWWTVPRLAICGAIQLALAAQFLLAYPLEYINGAFEFGRVFTYRWSVNWKFVPENVFVSKVWAIGLLVAQVLFLGLFALSKWLIPKAFLYRRLSPKRKTNKIIINHLFFFHQTNISFIILLLCLLIIIIF